jgi:hypothetical protein
MFSDKNRRFYLKLASQPPLGLPGGVPSERIAYDAT